MRLTHITNLILLGHSLAGGVLQHWVGILTVILLPVNGVFLILTSDKYLLDA
jgi:predicted alpha/beta hydrolase family esterase